MHQKLRLIFWPFRSRYKQCEKCPISIFKHFFKKHANMKTMTKRTRMWLNLHGCQAVLKKVILVLKMQCFSTKITFLWTTWQPYLVMHICFQICMLYILKVVPKWKTGYWWIWKMTFVCFWLFDSLFFEKKKKNLLHPSEYQLGFHMRYRLFLH